MNKFFLLLLLLLFALPVRAEVSDFLADEINKENISKPVCNLNYNYESTKAVPISLRITEKISTKDKDIYEGMPLNFKAEKSVYSGHTQIVKEGQIVEGKINSIISSGLNGIPYAIILSDFKVPNVLQSKLEDEYQKEGFNRTWLVLPLKWALTFLPPTGSLTNFIKGGHAKITPKDEIVIYYYPEWQ